MQNQQALIEIEFIIRQFKSKVKQKRNMFGREKPTNL